MSKQPRDFPLQECVEQAEKYILQGAMVYQKFTCQHCRSRQTMNEANVFFTSGKCEECDHVTDIKKRGCNYLLIWSKPIKKA